MSNFCGETDQEQIENPEPEADANLVGGNVELVSDRAEDDIGDEAGEYQNESAQNIFVGNNDEPLNNGAQVAETVEIENEIESVESERVSTPDTLQGQSESGEAHPESYPVANVDCRPVLQIQELPSEQQPECDQPMTTPSDDAEAEPRLMEMANESNHATVHEETHRTNATEVLNTTVNGCESDQTSSNMQAEALSASVDHVQMKQECVRPKQKTFPISRKSPPGIDFLHLSDSSEDELLNELDAALLDRNRKKTTPKNVMQQSQTRNSSNSNLEINLASNGMKPFPLKDSNIALNIEQKIEELQRQLKSKEDDLKSSKLYAETLLQKCQETEKEKNHFENEVKKFKDSNEDSLYIPQIKELEKTIASQEKEIHQTKEALTSHDTLAKKKIATMQNDYKSRIDQITKMYEDCIKEKDTMVMNYAIAEQKNIEAKKLTEKAEIRLKESQREQENLLSKMKAMKMEKQKLVDEKEAKVNEVAGVLKEMEHMKEMLTSADVRIKWAQNKLKSELESHKETKIELEKTNQKLKMAKEETMQIRKDCQAIVKQYQESEEIKSNSLDKELKQKESELIVQRQEKSDSEEVYNMTVKELEVLKAKHKDSVAELKTLRDKVYCLESERKDTDETMTKYKEIMQKQKGENKTIKDKISSMSQLEEDFNRAQDMIKNLDREISDLRITNKDLQSDIEGCRTRESELLELTQKLSRTNAKLQSENTTVNNQVLSLSSKSSNMEIEVQNLETRCQDLENKLSEEVNKFESECSKLKKELTEKTSSVSDLKQKLEDEKDLNKTLKRKHANNIKDLTRQLQQAKKKLETYEHTEKDGTSLGSRTSSNGSLNDANHSQTAASNHHQHHHHHHSNNHSNNYQSTVQSVRPPDPEYPVITEQVEVDKNVLIERIVRLQKAHARKNEKLEFLQDHIQQLVDEVQRKKKIIQSYILREEQGALAPESMDENKALLAKKGGIMASLYNHHVLDGHMTLELSLEINQKLQSVLEDTLLKNITLKESIDTLGQEIARLSKENRQLQLRLQGH